MKKAIIISPTYNEAKNIDRLLLELSKVISKIKNWKVEVLIVDDSSPDGTYKLVEKLQKKYKFLKLLINKEKAGLGTAYLKGMAHAFNKLGADVVFEFDADLSHDPRKIPELLAKIDEGYDMALGSRYIKGGGIPSDWGLHRKFLSVFGNLIITLILTDFRVRDWTGGYRAITKKIYQAVYKEMGSARFSGYTFQIGFLRKAMRKGFKVAEVPFKFVDRTEGESKLGADYLKNILLYIFTERFKEITSSRVFKFAFVGGVGAMIQFSTALLYVRLIDLSLSLGFLVLSLPDILAIETAIVSNFILNNAWTFADRKLHPSEYFSKFIKFNIASLGSLVIQTIVIGLGLGIFGLFDVITLPIIGLTISSRILYHALGIVIGLFWNFFAYNKFIWKSKK